MAERYLYKNRQGFTLLEVLIATVVLAVSLAGLYTIIKTNITTSEFIKRKIELSTAGSELFYTLYSSEKEIESTGTYLNYEDHRGVKYRIEKKPLGYFDISEITLYIKKDGSEIAYHFYK